VLHNLLFILVPFVITFAACDKKAAMEGVHEVEPIAVMKAEMPDIPPPPVIRPMFPDVLEASDVMLVAHLPDPGPAAEVPSDLSPVVHAQVQHQVQEDLHERAEKLKRDAEEIKKLLEKKRKQLGKQGFDKWKATRPSPKRKPRPYTKKPPSLRDRLRKL
jgi:hypothetical protein